MNPPIPNGTLVRKTNTKAGDTHQDGALGRVKSSIGPADDGVYGYFVEWNSLPGLPVFIAGTRIQKAE